MAVVRKGFFLRAIVFLITATTGDGSRQRGPDIPMTRSASNCFLKVKMNAGILVSRKECVSLCCVTRSV